MIEKITKIVLVAVLVGFSVPASALTIVNNVAFPKELQGDSDAKMFVAVMDEGPDSNYEVVRLPAPFSSTSINNLSYMQSITVLTPDIDDPGHPGKVALDVANNCTMIENVSDSAKLVLTGKVDPDSPYHDLADVIIKVSCELKTS